MEIAVAVKPVPDAETRLRPSADGRTLDPEGVKFTLAGYDESAVEQALLLKEAGAATAVRVLSVGPAPRTEEVLRASLALGCDRATWIETAAVESLDAVHVARLLAAALRPALPGLVLVGKQANDEEGGLVGPALAESLGVPDFPAAVNLRFDGGSSRFTFESVVEGGSYRTTAAAPLVVTLQQAWNDPRTAKLPNILKSRKTPIERIASASLGVPPRSGQTAVTKFRLPPARAGAVLITAKTADEAARELVRRLRDDAKVLS